MIDYFYCFKLPVYATSPKAGVISFKKRVYVEDMIGCFFPGYWHILLMIIETDLKQLRRGVSQHDLVAQQLGQRLELPHRPDTFVLAPRAERVA